jgi:hypothetical protein
MALKRVGEWRGRSVEVTGHLIPRYLWTTASIDVFIDSDCVLQTGGELKIVGASTAQFYDSGSDHQIVLEWGRPAITGFPIEITIDGELVARSYVTVDNWPLALWPALLVAAGAAAALWPLWAANLFPSG